MPPAMPHAHKLKLIKVASAHVDEISNTALAGGAGLFGIALADIATWVTIMAGLLSIIGLGLGIYLKWLQIRDHKSTTRSSADQSPQE